MSSTLVRQIRASLLFAALAVAARMAPAHTYVLALGEAAGATSYFGVICSTEGGYESDHLYMQIRTDTASAALVSAQVIKGTVASSTTDPVSGDAEASPVLRHRGGNGLYQVLTTKTAPGAVTFTVTVHCLDVTGTQHTGIDAIVYQYQDR